MVVLPEKSWVKAPRSQTRLALFSLSPVFKKRGFRMSWAAFLKMRPKKTRPEGPAFGSGFSLGGLVLLRKYLVFSSGLSFLILHLSY